MYLEGGEDLIVIPMDSVPGQNFKDKRAHLLAASSEQIMALVESSKGSAYRLDAGEDELLVIPTGMMVMWASHGASCLRWGVSSDEQDTHRVHQVLECVLGSFSEFRRADNVMFQLFGCLHAD